VIIIIIIFKNNIALNYFSAGNLLLRENYFEMKTKANWGSNAFPVTYLEATNKAKNFLLK